MDETTRKLSIVFEKIYSMDGIEVVDGGYNIISDVEMVFKGGCINYYLLLSTLSKMLKVGDIKFEVVSNISKRNEFLQKLLAEIQ